MKRSALSIGLSGVLLALWAPTAFGFSGAFDFVGSVKGAPMSSVGFFAEHPDGGPKRVTGFTVTQVPYECSDAPPGVTAGWQFEPKMRVKSRKFEGSGDWTGLPLDPVGTVSGKLRPGGAAVGDLKLSGELAGSGTHCHTGRVGWKATKGPPVS